MMALRRTIDRIYNIYYWRVHHRAFAQRLKKELVREAEYDRQHGVDTGGNAPLTAFGLSPEEAERGNNVYRSVWHDEFHSAMRALPICLEETTFIDYGSGKGKAMLMASDYPFQEILGIEYARPLHECAVRNIAAYKSDRQRCFRIRSLHLDATQFEPPATSPLLCFFFNPFDDETLRGAFERLDASARACPRPIHILYVNLRNVNERRHVIGQARGFTEIARARTFVLLRHAVSA